MAAHLQDGALPVEGIARPWLVQGKSGLAGGRTGQTAGASRASCAPCHKGTTFAATSIERKLCTGTANDINLDVHQLHLLAQPRETEAAQGQRPE